MTVRALGIMSGTSLDGLSVAYAEIEEGKDKSTFAFVAGETYELDRNLREKLLQIAEGKKVTTSVLARAHWQIGSFSAKCVSTFLSAHSLPSPNVIGFHGQTVYHEPRRSGSVTLQIGDPSQLCYKFGSAVVSDFRSMDCAAGGQGAPLVPFVDYVLYSGKKQRAILNIGGISNVTFLKSGCRLSDVIAYDVGPGNMVIDAVVRRLFGSSLAYDPQGSIAASGRVSQELIKYMWEIDQFHSIEPPKSTGRERYGKRFVDDVMAKASEMGLKPEDTVATVSYFTYVNIEQALKSLVQKYGPIDEIIVGGGATKNLYLMGLLSRSGLSNKLNTHQMYGISPDLYEPYAFAILAHFAINGYASNVPSATGAKSNVILGRINFPDGKTLDT